MQYNEVDLTEYSDTFEELPTAFEIPLDSKLREIRDAFSANEVVVLCGPQGSGKTTHLTQFVQSEKTRCFSYFLRDDPWTLRQDTFLSNMCSQMSVALGQPPTDFGTDVERLKSIFNNLTARVIGRAKASRYRYYFVIDGLDLSVKGARGERISDLLPLQTRQKSLNLLGSVDISAESDLPVKFFRETPHLFSILETTTFLRAVCHSLTLSAAHIKTLHDLSGGMPGYLASTASMLVDGRLTPDGLTEAPEGLEPLIDLWWKSLQLQDSDPTWNAIELMAFALKPLDLGAISRILNVGEHELRTAIFHTGIVRELSGCLHFYPELFKKVAQSRLRHRETKALEVLTTYYESRPEDQFLLADYHAKRKDYRAVVRLLEPPQLAAAVRKHQGLNQAMRQMQRAADLALNEGDMPNLLRFGLASAQLRTLAHELSGESEIRALVAMKDYDRALSRAYSMGVAELRVRLLSHVYLAMEADGRTISREALFELEQQAAIVSESADPDTALQMAVDLFPLLPETATQIVDRANIQGDARDALDLVAALATLRSTDADDQLIDRIENTKLRELALIGSSQLNQVSAERILERAAKASETKSKESLLRHWILENRRHPDVHRVLNAALDAIINAPNDYRVPLRNLRQLSEALKYVSNEHRLSLMRRFEAPAFTSLSAPFEERLHLDLNLLESLWEADAPQALAGLRQASETVASAALDVDVQCYCYARLYITARRVDPENKTGWGPKWRLELEDRFLQLLETSALQDKVTRRILSALCRADPDLAIEFATTLNRVSRRDRAVRNVLGTYTRQEDIPVSVKVIDRGLRALQSGASRNLAIRDMIKGLRTSKRLEGTLELRTFAIEIAKSVEDPIVRCQSLAIIISTLKLPSDEPLRSDLIQALMETWGNIEALWQQVEAGFDILQGIAEADLRSAHEFYEKLHVLRSASVMANQSLASMIFHTVKLAVRFATRLNLLDTEGVTGWDQVLKCIEQIPSPTLRALLYSQCALGRLRYGDRSTFDTLVRDRVLPEIAKATPSDFKSGLLATIVPAVFEYSREEAAIIVRDLPYDLVNAAWAETAINILRRSNLGDPTGTEPPNVAIDLRSAHDVLFILEQIGQDATILFVVECLVFGIENQNSKLNEQQRLDLLGQIETLVERKLPDPVNIRHPGYRIAAQAVIERGFRKVAKRSKPDIQRQRSQKLRAVADNARQLANIADKVFVLAETAKNIYNIDKGLSLDLFREAESLVSSIPNAQDRIGRLEIIARQLYSLDDRDRARHLVQLASSMTDQMAGLEQQQVQASLIQMVHQFDSEIAAKLTEKIGDVPERYGVQITEKVMELQRNPHKLIQDFQEYVDGEILERAATLMLGSLIDNRAVVHSEAVLTKWLSMCTHVDFQSANRVAEWVSESMMRNRSPGAVHAVALEHIKSLIVDLDSLFALGGVVDALADVPEKLRIGFQGLSATVKLFEVNERDKVVAWLNHWISNHVKKYVKICDPYFDSSQLWILRYVPSSVTVQIVTSQRRESQADLRSDESSIKSEYQRAWREIADQNAPPTLVMIYPQVFGSARDDEFHDRYITTEGSGLALGTSLNGFGNKQSTITELSAGDAEYIETTYIEPKLDMATALMRAAFFRLG